MSATPEPGWLDTIDFRGEFPAPPLELDATDHDPALPLHGRMAADKTLGRLDAEATKDGKAVAKAVWEDRKAATRISGGYCGWNPTFRRSSKANLFGLSL